MIQGINPWLGLLDQSSSGLVAWQLLPLMVLNVDVIVWLPHGIILQMIITMIYKLLMTTSDVMLNNIGIRRCSCPHAVFIWLLSLL